VRDGLRRHVEQPRQIGCPEPERLAHVSERLARVNAAIGELAPDREQRARPHRLRHERRAAPAASERGRGDRRDHPTPRQRDRDGLGPLAQLALAAGLAPPTSDHAPSV